MTSTEVASGPTPAATLFVPSTPSDPEATIATPSTITLTVWTNSDISPRSEVPGGPILVEQLALFEENHPGLNVNVELKSPGGQGGILSYLRAGRDVAPRILPDLVLLPTGQLASAAADRLIYPLDGLIDPAATEDLFPAGRVLAQSNGQFVGYPYTLSNLQHVVYNTTVITTTFPLAWNQINEAPVSLVFPAAGPDGTELLLSLYLEAGGALVDEAGQPALQVEPLTAALAQLSQSRSNGQIALQSSNITTLDEAWQLYQDGVASVVLTTAGQYLARRSLAAASGYAPLIGLDAPLPTYVRGWAWAVSTADPMRQALAVELLTWLTLSQHAGEWSWQSGNLPARRSAFDHWPADDAYVDFLQDELERARPYPAGATSVIMTALSDALFNVVSLSTSPQVAAETAAADVRP